MHTFRRQDNDASRRLPQMVLSDYRFGHKRNTIKYCAKRPGQEFRVVKSLGGWIVHHPDDILLRRVVPFYDRCVGAPAIFELRIPFGVPID